jgi:hypothetical protein
LATLLSREQFRQKRPSTGIKVLGFTDPIDRGWATCSSPIRPAESQPKVVGLLNIGAVHGPTASLLMIRMSYRFSPGTPLLAFKLTEAIAIVVPCHRVVGKHGDLKWMNGDENAIRPGRTQNILLNPLAAPFSFDFATRNGAPR